MEGKRVLRVAERESGSALQRAAEHSGVETLVDRDAVDEQVSDEHMRCGNPAMELFACRVDGDHTIAGAEDDAAVGQSQRTVFGEGVAQHVVGEQVAPDVVVARVHTRESVVGASPQIAVAVGDERFDIIVR